MDTYILGDEISATMPRNGYRACEIQEKATKKECFRRQRTEVEKPWPDMRWAMHDFFNGSTNVRTTFPVVLASVVTRAMSSIYSPFATLTMPSNRS